MTKSIAIHAMPGEPNLMFSVGCYIAFKSAKFLRIHTFQDHRPRRKKTGIGFGEKSRSLSDES